MFGIKQKGINTKTQVISAMDFWGEEFKSTEILNDISKEAKEQIAAQTRAVLKRAANCLREKREHRIPLERGERRAVKEAVAVLRGVNSRPKK